MTSRSEVTERLRTPAPAPPPADDLFFDRLAALAMESVPRAVPVRPTTVRVVAAAAGVALVTTGVAVAVDQWATPEQDTPLRPTDHPTPPSVPDGPGDGGQGSRSPDRDDAAPRHHDRGADERDGTAADASSGRTDGRPAGDGGLDEPVAPAPGAEPSGSQHPSHGAGTPDDSDDGDEAADQGDDTAGTDDQGPSDDSGQVDDGQGEDDQSGDRQTGDGGVDGDGDQE